MDISVFISDLLYEHDCVIVPGFGGFICNYRPAEIHPVLHFVNPPSKSVSFNRNLRTNDGLLVNYIAKTGDISFQTAQELIQNWVESSKSLLRKSETINLKNIGRVFSDIEGNIQFTPDESVNYLKASFALKPLSARPVLRGKEVDFTEKFVQETKKHVAERSNTWKIAAAILLLVGIGSLVQMMRMGIEVKPLGLNEASVFSFLTHFSKGNEDTMQPIAVASEKTLSTSVADTSNNVIVRVAPFKMSSPPVQQTAPVKAQQELHGYYVITGAFSDAKNAENAKRDLQNRFPGVAILTDKAYGLTRIGYMVGSDSKIATQKLHEAQTANAEYWLLKK
jgi:CCDC81-like prokaryotic HU domain 1/CCDC81-like prokaryotic HU domain 2